jgi:hypothetical protein
MRQKMRKCPYRSPLLSGRTSNRFHQRSLCPTRCQSLFTASCRILGRPAVLNPPTNFSQPRLRLESLRRLLRYQPLPPRRPWPRVPCPSGFIRSVCLFGSVVPDAELIEQPLALLRRRPRREVVAEAPGVASPAAAAAAGETAAADIGTVAGGDCSSHSRHRSRGSLNRSRLAGIRRHIRRSLQHSR